MTARSQNSVERSGVLDAWKVPKNVLVTSGIMLLVMLMPIGLVGWFAGIQALTVFLFALAICSPPASRLPPRAALQLIAIAAVTAAVAVALQGMPFPAACFVVLVALLAAPANLVDNGLLGMLVPYTTVFLASPSLQVEPAAAALWTFMGGLLLVALMLKTPKPTQLTGINPATAYRHAVVTAIAVGTAIYLVMRFNLPHGYWVPMTMGLVLQPFGRETRTKARQRILGTIGGGFIALVLALLLPAWGIALLILPLSLLNSAYSLLGRYAQAVVFLTPSVVLMANLASQDAEIQATVERLIATLIGGLLAAGLALILEDVDERHPDPVVTGESEAPAM